MDEIKKENPEETEPAASKLGMLLWIIVSMVATVFSYQLGLQQGMQAAKSESPKQWLYYFDENLEQHAEALSQAVEATRPPAPAMPDVPVPQKNGYTLQMVTYRGPTLAGKEVERLKKKGHKAFVVTSGDFYLVCVEFFESRDLAMKKLVQLRKEKYYETYPGAFVKFLKR